MKQYSTKAFAKLCGLSKDTIIRYDSSGWLKPHHRDSKNRRVYTDEEYQKFLKIGIKKDYVNNMNKKKKGN